MKFYIHFITCETFTEINDNTRVRNVFAHITLQNNFKNRLFMIVITLYVTTDGCGNGN